MAVHRSAAFIIAVFCCRLSFCHQLATAGPNWTWSTGSDTYLAQSLGQEWHCDVATSECRLAKEPATGVSRTTFVGIQLWALCSACGCLLLALGRSRRRLWSIQNLVCIGILGLGWLGFAADVTQLATPTRAAWGIAICPVAIALLVAAGSKAPQIPRARVQR